MKTRLLAPVAALLILFGAVGDHLWFGGSSAAIPAAAATTTGTTATTSPSTGTTVDTASIDAATVHAYAVASKSVVYVVSAGVGSGSGVIYDTNGDIVTNDHVVSGATSLSVTLNDGRTFHATLVGTDAADDLAVIRIHTSGLTPAHFAAGGSYQVAQTVLAIGSPVGLKQSVSSGLISGLNRVEQEPNGAYIANAVQTSAPINPGNSGGALVTLNGTVVGIPTLEQTSTDSGTSTQNIGFAIPSERVTLIANQIIATGKVEHTGRPYLGIAPTDSTGQSASPFFGGNGDTQTRVSGALVAQVSSNGPAAQAGVQQGDIITRIDGAPVTSASDLLTVLATRHPGDTVTLTLNRNGQTMSVKVHLGELPG